MSKTLLAYVTRYGATTETATVIAEVLKDKYDIDVDLIDIKENKDIDISQYENVILGVSFAKFRWAKEGKRFLKKNDFKGKKIFVFVSSGRAGNAFQKNNLEKYQKLQKKFIDNVLEKLKLQYTSRKAFGGRFVQGGIEKWDNRNWDDIRSWAEEIGELITKD
ncbi:MAG: flavodoxin domain-containing protein [Promethearchaeota archaeon]